MPNTELKNILNSLSEHSDTLRPIREMLLANAVMIGEIPAPTGEEEERITFLGNRYNEEGLDNISIDQAGNCMAMIPGSVGENNILVCAHADTVFHSKIDHAMSVHKNTISGPGIGDNSLGLAALATLPEVLKRLDLQLKDNVILLADSGSLGLGNLSGIRFFLDNFKSPIRAGVCVEGIHLGRLSYKSVGMLRGEIKVSMPAEYDWTRFGASNPVAILSKVIQSMMRIPIPNEPETKIIFGSMNAGTSYATQPTSATLRFEIRSEEVGMVAKLRVQIEDIIEEMASSTNTVINLAVIAQRRTGGLEYGHPLVKCIRSIHTELGIKSHVLPSVGELSELIAHKIPGVTLGLTKGSHKNENEETIEIQPAFDGLAQLVALLQAIDGGLCDE